jgi:hypothetical protein
MRTAVLPALNLLPKWKIKFKKSFIVSAMKFCVIGEPCIDYIHRINKVRKNMGGILYCVVSLAVIADTRHEIIPVISIGHDEYEAIISFLKGFKNINTDHINKIDTKTRVVNLYYREPGTEFISPEGKEIPFDREETSTEPTPPIEYESIEPVLKEANGVLISMISGVDITLDTFKNIRSNFSGYIHFDSHNIVMKTYPDGKRVQEPVADWKQWCTLPDTLQMNETEISTITPEKLREYDFADEVLYEGVQGTKALVVTRGKTGVTLFRKIKKEVFGEKYQEIDRTDVPSIESSNFKDSTGCGDVFASCFFYKNAVLEKPDFQDSLRYANRKASINTTLLGVEELYKLNG